MADKKKGRQRKVEERAVDGEEEEESFNFKKLKKSEPEEEKPTKEEYAVAKYLRFGLPAREGKLHGMEVKCFFGNAAVDKLLESKWSATKNKKDPIFTSRVSCVSYLVRLLEKGLFHRAEREKRKKEKEKSKKKKKDKDGEKEETGPPEEELRKRKGKKDKSKTEKGGETTADDEAEKKVEGERKDEKEKKDDKKKKEKRLKLVMPEEQFFEDGDEVYVWIYDPVNATTFLIGLLMVLGAIALCMFPLWPEEVRVGVYYLSLAAAGFVGFILLLVVVRMILFCCIWVLTFGKHHFWLFPNLTEDVGFFDSFRPLYKHDVIRSVEKKEKSSDKDDSDEFELIKQEDLDQNGVEDNEADGDDTEEGDIENDYDDKEGGDGEVEDDDENGESEEEDEEEDESEPSETRDTKKTK